MQEQRCDECRRGIPLGQVGIIETGTATYHVHKTGVCSRALRARLGLPEVEIPQWLVTSRRRARLKELGYLDEAG